MNARHITTKSAAEAWREADKLFPCDYLHDSIRSARAGYDIYMSTNPEVYAWISDLGDRLEVNMPDGSSVNVWIEPEEEAEEAKNETETAETETNSAENEEEQKTITARVCFDFGSCATVGITLYDGLSIDECIALRSEKIAEYRIEGEYWTQRKATAKEARQHLAAIRREKEAERERPETVSAEESRAEVEAMEAAQRFTADAISAEVCQRVTVVINGGGLARCDDERRIYNALLRGSPLGNDVLTKFAESTGLRWGCIQCESVNHYKHGNTGSGHFCITGTISAGVGEELSFLAACADILSEAHDSNRK